MNEPTEPTEPSNRQEERGDRTKQYTQELNAAEGDKDKKSRRKETYAMGRYWPC